MEYWGALLKRAGRPRFLKTQGFLSLFVLIFSSFFPAVLFKYIDWPLFYLQIGLGQILAEQSDA